jgi:itaconate CoA-transferase
MRSATTDDDDAPLGGIVVVSLEQAISAPFATRQLADLGAEVIKVEPPGGDFARHYDQAMGGQSANFVWANRGKKSIVLDLRDAGDRATLDALIAGADVFVHNMSPGAARRLGIGADALHARHPALVACEISGYGGGGPRSDDKAYDLAIQAEAGAFSVTGAEEMSKVGFSAADIAAAMYALAGILAALVRRSATGRGGTVRVSMLDGLAEWMSAPLYGAVYGPGQPERTGRRHHAIAPYGTFRLSDGSTILLAVQSDGEWQRMAEVVLGDAALGTDERFASNPARIAHVAVLEELVSAALAGLPTPEALARLASARIAVARVNDLDGVWAHEQLRARSRFRVAATPTGDVEVLAAPFEIGGWDPPQGAVPALDEDGPAIRAALRVPRTPGDDG